MAVKIRQSALRNKTCFVAAPIGAPQSQQRKISNYLLSMVIKPAVTEAGYKIPKRLDHISPQGNLNDRIVEMLLSSDLVIVDLTGRNPNVIFEMALRQGWDLPFIPIAPGNELPLPFDFIEVNTVIYGPLDPKGKLSAKQVNAAKAAIKKQIGNIGKRRPVLNGRFRQAIEKIGKAYSLDAVYEAKQLAIKVIIQEIAKVRKEVESDFELKRHSGRRTSKFDPFSSLIDMIERPFSNLREQVWVFDQIVRSSGAAEDLNSHCLEICNRLQKIQNIGKEIVKMSRTSSITTINRKKSVLKKLNDIDREASTVRKMIDERRNLPKNT